MFVYTQRHGYVILFTSSCPSETLTTLNPFFPNYLYQFCVSQMYYTKILKFTFTVKVMSE